MSYFLSKRSVNRLVGIEKFQIDVLTTGIVDSPWDFGIPQYGGLRTSNDQKELYAIGRTVEVGRKPVTWKDGVIKKSKHQMRENGVGWAFDIYIYDHDKNRASWNEDKLTEVAVHLLKVSQKLAEENEEYKGFVLEWGGNFKKWKDLPHFQLRKL